MEEEDNPLVLPTYHPFETEKQNMKTSPDRCTKAGWWIVVATSLIFLLSWLTVCVYTVANYDTIVEVVHNTSVLYRHALEYDEAAATLMGELPQPEAVTKITNDVHGALECVKCLLKTFADTGTPTCAAICNNK
jgi:hypothetical protein